MPPRPPSSTLFPYTTLFRSMAGMEFHGSGEIEKRLHYTVQADDLAGNDVHLLAEVVIALDRKSTRLNSSHPSISYAVFCLNKKKIEPISNQIHAQHPLHSQGPAPISLSL